MRSKTRYFRRKHTIRRVVISIAAFILLAVVFFELTVKDRLEMVIISEVKTHSQTALNNAVSDFIDANDDLCTNLIDISNDSTGVRCLRENSSNVNKLKAKLVVTATDYIQKELAGGGIDIKLGNFIGLVTLSEFGPYVHFSIESVPNVSCEMNSYFESAGINQTIHHIELVVTVDIFVGNPLKIESIKFSSDYEISQTVIVGNTPSGYGGIISGSY